MSPLAQSFFLQDDVVEIAKNLLGKLLLTSHEGVITGGLITETEAYAGITDRASHAFGGRKSKRNEAMYEEGGIAYVYKCYGIHYLLNAVTGKKDNPNAVLIRAIFPLFGIEIMLKRRKKKILDARIASGPGMLSEALGIDLRHNKISLNSPILWIEQGEKAPPSDIESGPRIGIEYAKEDAFLPYRFLWKNSKKV